VLVDITKDAQQGSCRGVDWDAAGRPQACSRPEDEEAARATAISGEAIALIKRRPTHAADFWAGHTV